MCVCVRGEKECVIGLAGNVMSEIGEQGRLKQDEEVRRHATNKNKIRSKKDNWGIMFSLLCFSVFIIK